MNADLLRRACEAAQLPVCEDEVLLDHFGWSPLDHDVTHAYVASRLVTKAREKIWRGHIVPTILDHWWMDEEHRIRAALEVLKVTDGR